MMTAAQSTTAPQANAACAHSRLHVPDGKIDRIESLPAAGSTPSPLTPNRTEDPR